MFLNLGLLFKLVDVLSLCFAEGIPRALCRFAGLGGKGPGQRQFLMTLIERLAVGTMAPLRVVWVEARQTAVLVVRLSEEVFAADLSRRPLALESIESSTLAVPALRERQKLGECDC
ncbi:hypothetical protein KCU73_g59, partial [Aureobasidium melanogenum]